MEQYAYIQVYPEPVHEMLFAESEELCRLM